MSGPNGIGGPPLIDPLLYTNNQGGQQPQAQQPQQPQQPAGGGGLPNNARPVSMQRHGAAQLLNNKFRTTPPTGAKQAYVIDTGEPGGAKSDNAITLDTKTEVSPDINLKNLKSCVELVQKTSKDVGDIASPMYQVLGTIKVT